MYCPRPFREDRLSALHALVRSHSLGAWTCWADNRLVVNHVPFLLAEEAGESGTLVGHVARGNPVWKSIANGDPDGARGGVPGAVPSVVVFQGPQTYITPSWYPSKQVHGKVVPTWNYAVVHAHGRPRVIEDKAWLLAHVEQLSDTHEAERESPWRVSDAPQNYIDKMLDGIVGIEIPIQTLEGRWKVSQNKPPADKSGVAGGLSESPDAVAREMATLVNRAMR